MFETTTYNKCATTCQIDSYKVSKSKLKPDQCNCKETGMVISKAPLQQLHKGAKFSGAPCTSECHCHDIQRAVALQTALQKLQKLQNSAAKMLPFIKQLGCLDMQQNETDFEAKKIVHKSLNKEVHEYVHGLSTRLSDNRVRELNNSKLELKHLLLKTSSGLQNSEKLNLRTH